MAERLNAAVRKTVDRASPSPGKPDPRVRIPLSPPSCTAKLFERPELLRLALIFSRFVPVRTFALRTDAGFLILISGNPFVPASLATIAPDGQLYSCHG